MATAPKAAPKAGASAEAAPVKKSKAKLFIMLGLGLLLLGGGGGGAAWYFMGHNAGAAGAAKKAEPPKPPVFAMLDPFTVNLQPENGEQYLQVAMTLQVADQAQVDMIKLYTPIVRGRILMLLSSKKASELSTPAGKQKLADEVATQVKQPFAPNSTPANVGSVHFTSFVIQ